ncbi:MAG: TIGR04086 family membrane protein [Clostridia bacterium]|nr:TIGR04086 family membrane protein [Clostridia bacterium]
MKNNSIINILNILKGVVIAILLTLVFLLIFAIILTYTNVKEDTISPVIIVITALSIIIGSSVANMKISKNGIFNGAIIAIIYMLIIYLISSLVSNQFEITGASLIMILTSVICGILGGIIGVNKK